MLLPDLLQFVFAGESAARPQLCEPPAPIIQSPFVCDICEEMLIQLLFSLIKAALSYMHCVAPIA
jgi:hypothetical protein